MKVIINKCFGGFSLSAAATARLAELKGRKCFFFKNDIGQPYVAITVAQAAKAFSWSAFDIPNPNEVLTDSSDWNKMTLEQRKAANALSSAHSHDNRPDERHDPHLVQTVEELGDKANGMCAKLAVVEIPDGVAYEIDEYDGQESIHETHRSWG